MASAESKPCSDIELTEFTTLKANYELINKTYRWNHREMEREVNALNKSLDDVENISTVGQAAELLDKVISGVSSLKRKAAVVFAEESRLVQGCKRRIDHLKNVTQVSKKMSHSERKFAAPGTGSSHGPGDTGSTSSGMATPDTDMTGSDYTEWLARFHRLLADHLFASGQHRSALSLALHCPVGHLCLIDIYQEAVSVETGLLHGDTGPAHAWCQAAKYKTKNTEDLFEFDLRVFEFYLLVKVGKQMEAITHARKHLSDVKKPDDYRATKLGQAMILLAMRNSDEIRAKAEENELTEKWIVKRFHTVLLKFYAFAAPTPFSLATKAGVSVIKTQYCYTDAMKKSECAVCHPLVNRLARGLPLGRHDHSLLTCYQSGLPMDDENPPLALPNGYVYSQKGLAQLVQADGTVTCPRTGQTYKVTQAQRVYIV